MAKANQIGRSMVEMLGVLAIIGVLSVGSISGYSKAMLKHKMNKQAEQLNTVFNLASRYNKQIRFDDSTSHSVVEMFIKLGELPKEMLKNINYGQCRHDSHERYLVITSPSTGISSTLKFRLIKWQWKLVQLEN